MFNIFFSFLSSVFLFCFFVVSFVEKHIVVFCVFFFDYFVFQVVLIKF